MDVSEGILANLDAGHPCRHDEICFSCSASKCKLMKYPSETTSFKRIPEPFEVGDFGDRLALFLALAGGPSRITERNNP
jgi:hypothetical protein